MMFKELSDKGQLHNGVPQGRLLAAIRLEIGQGQLICTPLRRMSMACTKWSGKRP